MTRSMLSQVLFASSVSILSSLAFAAPIPGNDPLAAIDLNRNAIIADIVQGLDGDRDAMAKRLSGLRADRLLSASLTSTRESLEAILHEAEKSNEAAVRRASAKSLGSATVDLVYTPLTPCRLIDTRGFGAPIQGGAFTSNARRGYVPQGLCGLPTANVASILISFTTQNLTPNSGGYLAILAPNAPVTASVDVFNLGAEWSASNTAVVTGSAAQFDVLVAVANAHVVIDVLGYFAAPQGNITLPQSTAGAGNIMKGNASFIHNFGTSNTFIGENAGNFSMSGGSNTAIGKLALQGNVDGSGNTAAGASALQSNSSGVSNVANGANALVANTIGSANTAIGTSAMQGNVSGFNNTALGTQALIGSTGSGNIAVGSGAGNQLTAGNNNIFIGHAGVVADGGTTRIGTSQSRAFISGIRGVTTTLAAVPVLIDNNGQLGTTSSSRRVKDDIADMDAASDALMKLRPVTFHYKAGQGSTERALQYGLIAEEVAEVYPGLVAHSADGEVETVMYQHLPPMLLNEVQKLRHTVDAQAAEIAALKRAVTELGGSRRK